MKNFRAHRFTVDWSIIVSARNSAPVAGHITDIGLTGLRYISARQFKLRDILKVEITDHKAVQINTTARVVWKRTMDNGQYIYGLTYDPPQFADLPILEAALSGLLQRKFVDHPDESKFAKHDGSRPWLDQECEDQKAA